MRAFVVIGTINNEVTFEGVFSTKKLAHKFIQNKKDRLTTYQIYDTIIDYNNYVQTTKVKLK